VNPHLVDIDGSTNISGAGVAYLVGREINKKNKDLASCAITGAIGDRQDKGEDFKLIGINEKIVQDGIKTKTVEMIKDLRFFGRETRPIYFQSILRYNTTTSLTFLGCQEITTTVSNFFKA
jgi:RecJ-like exonuclease